MHEKKEQCVVKTQPAQCEQTHSRGFYFRFKDRAVERFSATQQPTTMKTLRIGGAEKEYFQSFLAGVVGEV